MKQTHLIPAITAVSLATLMATVSAQQYQMEPYATGFEHGFLGMTFINDGPYGSDLIFVNDPGPTRGGAADGSLLSVDASGEISVFATGLFDPTRLAFDEFGNFGSFIYVVNQRTWGASDPIVRINPDATFTTLADAGTGCRALAISPGGEFGDFIYVDEYFSSTIKKVNSDGEVFEFASANNVTELVFAPTPAYGNDLYALTYNGEILRIDSSGASTQFAAFPDGASIAFGKNDAFGNYLYGVVAGGGAQGIVTVFRFLPDADDDGAADAVEIFFDTSIQSSGASYITFDGQGHMFLGFYAEGVGSIYRVSELDSDNDGLRDTDDNCQFVTNSDQRDTDNDNIGNACDPDIAPLPNDCFVNFSDLDAMRTTFFTGPADSAWNPDADFNGDDFVNFIDLALTREFFFSPPGPSGLPDACDL